MEPTCQFKGKTYRFVGNQGIECRCLVNGYKCNQRNMEEVDRDVFIGEMNSEGFLCTRVWKEVFEVEPFFQKMDQHFERTTIPVEKDFNLSVWKVTDTLYIDWWIGHRSFALLAFHPHQLSYHENKIAQTVRLMVAHADNIDEFIEKVFQIKKTLPSNVLCRICNPRANS